VQSYDQGKEVRARFLPVMPCAQGEKKYGLAGAPLGALRVSDVRSEMWLNNCLNDLFLHKFWFEDRG
jgi:hypothetical protein